MSLGEFYLQIHQLMHFFPEDLLGNIAVSILEALHYCKTRGVIHRDVKPENILINREGFVKLCDFGFARELINSVASTQVGTYAYIPPERINHPNEKYDIRSDIWSVGIILAELAYGKFPFNFKTDKDGISVIFTFTYKIKNIFLDCVSNI